MSPYATLVGGKYFKADGKSSLSKDPSWAGLLKWQKGLIDFYGYDKLVKWQTGAGDEFSASHAFETGKLAMMLDGEWRVSFIKDEHSELAVRDRPDAGGRRQEGPVRLGLHQRDDHRDPEERKESRRRLGARQVPDDERPCPRPVLERNQERPSTKSSSVSPELTPDKNFSTFLKLFTNPNSTTSPITPIGADHLQTFTNFFVKTTPER